MKLIVKEITQKIAESFALYNPRPCQACNRNGRRGKSGCDDDDCVKGFALGIQLWHCKQERRATFADLLEQHDGHGEWLLLRNGMKSGAYQADVENPNIFESHKGRFLPGYFEYHCPCDTGDKCDLVKQIKAAGGRRRLYADSHLSERRRLFASARRAGANGICDHLRRCRRV